MPEYGVAFGGLHIVIHYNDVDIFDFLNFLFHGHQCAVTDGSEAVLKISQVGTSGQYVLTAGREESGRHPLGVRFAAIVYDAVIFNLLNNNNQGVAFHAGAVALKEKIILMPGKSGSGKSTMTAWLTTQGFSYLSDELVFIPEADPDTTIPFTRPLCIKSGSAAEIKQCISHDDRSAILEDKDGLIIAHQVLNPEITLHPASPSLILFPVYKTLSPLRIQRIPGAQVCTLLMECDVNGRNLPDHGFHQIVHIARSTPAYQITYGNFEGLTEVLAELFGELQWT